jgi:hypothetical protein
MDYYDIVDFSPFLDKMRKGLLTLEEILNNDSIIDDLKSKENSEFLDFFTNKQIKKLIDYSTRFPKSDDQNTGYKYPFNSTEILCSESLGFFNKLMSEKKLRQKNTRKKKAQDFIKRIPKGGFFDVVFKAIKKAEGNNEEEIYQNWEDPDDLSFDENDSDNDTINNKENNNSNLIFNFYKNSLDSVESGFNSDNIVYENIDHLLEFLKESEETRKNYVLEGYFHRILSNLLTMDKNGKLIKYLLNYPRKEEFDVLHHFVKNMTRKSKNMFNIIQKLLLYKEEPNPGSHLYPELFKDRIKEKKIILLKLLLEELDLTQEEVKYECICDSLSALMSKTQFLENEYKDLNPLEYLYNILSNAKNNHKKSSYIFGLLIKINENILKLFDSRCTPIVEEENEESTNDIMSMYNSYNYMGYYNTGSFGASNRYSQMPEDNRSSILEKILKNLFDILEKNKLEFLDDFGTCDPELNKDFITTYLEKQRKIGIKKITEVEYLRTLFDIFINACYAEYYSDKVEILINLAEEKNIYWNLHNLFFLFPFSNIYQIYYSQIIDIIININSPKCLIDFFFFEKTNKKNLVDIYIEKILSNTKFEFKLTNTKVLSPIFSFMINLLNKINTTDNLYLSENYLNSNEKFQTFIEIFGKDIDTIFTQKLLSNGINNSSYQGFNFLDKSEEKLNYFGKKNFMELLEEDYDIYKLYENGEEYKDVLDKKRKRIKKEKEEKEKKKKTDIRKKETIKDLDDDDDDESPLFKIEKIKPNDDDNNFLSILNKSPEDNIQKKEDHEFDIKELENDGEIINDINVNVNEDIEPNKMENKIYNKMYNEDLKEENKEKEENNNEKDNKEKNEDNVNINEIGEVEDDIVDI